MKFETEVQLCQQFVAAHPRAEHLYFEVYMPTGRCDIVHKENTVITIYEAKLRLSIDLLEQCINRREYAHFVYAVVPSYKRHSFLEKLFTDYGIGVLTFWENRYAEPGDRIYRNIPTVRELKRPKLNRTPKTFKLYEENKKEIPGSQNAGITPFSIMVRVIKDYLLKKGKSPVDDVFKSQEYYGTLKQFKTNIYQWTRTGVIKGVKMERGELSLIKETIV